MQSLVSVLLGNSADVSGVNADTREFIAQLLNRAHQNIHGKALVKADANWAKSIMATALQLHKDPRVSSRSNREIIQLFENVIRISEEHLKVAKRNHAMALNVFYLKETALDNALSEQHLATHIHTAHSTVYTDQTSHSGYVNDNPLPNQHSDAS